MFKKTLIFTFILILCLLILPKKANAEELNFSPILESVVKINDNCSAVYIGNRLLLTASHCVADRLPGFFSKEKFEGANIVSKQQYYFDFIALDSINDIAVVKARNEPEGLIISKISDSVPSEGQHVWAVGYPGAMSRTITEGLFNGFAVDKFDGSNLTERYRSSAPIFKGNSGGGLFAFNKDHFELIGITVAIFQDVPHMNVSVTSKTIKEFLEKNKSKL